MINISHPRVHNKPPVNKCTSRSREEESLRTDSDAIRSQVSDCNQNIINSTSCSFEQLCNMINDLEKNIANEIPEMDQLQLEPERDNSGRECSQNGTTYNDIMTFLGKLEDGSAIEEKSNIPELDTAILEELFTNVQPLPLANYDSCRKIEGHVPHTFKEDLATAQLQLEEKNAAIVVLKDQLKSERKSALEKFDNQRKSHAAKLQAQEDKYKGIVKRHQKFIEQLIAEKTDLTEKCNSLTQRIKEMEIKAQRDLKTAADRHLVELQRAKEHYAAAEKIRRERWIETKTSKIKEMTVKGLEPELRSMIDQHEEEIQKLRNAHVKELQDAELRIVRRSNQQLEQLRLELTASHEKMLSIEKNTISCRFKEKLEEQEIQFKARQEKLEEELRNERLLFSKEQAKRDAEKDAILQRTQLQHQQEIETLKQQHQTEKRTLGETLKIEWEAWLADFKRQQITKVEKTENKIREECYKERDRQIELAIERLEKDSRETKQSLQQNFDCKLRSMREKHELDLQRAIDHETLQRDKLSHMQDKLERTEMQLQKTESKLQEYVCNLNAANEMLGRVSAERDNAKKIVRLEIEGEKRELEEKISSLYCEITQNNADRDASMAQLHSRIKLIITQKVLTIRNLTKELSEVKSKCEHLEKLLDQQRKEYILKGL